MSSPRDNTSERATISPTGQTYSIRCLFDPVKDNPAKAAKFVQTLQKCGPHSIDVVAAELAPLYGLGRASNRDVRARLRAQAVFTSPEISEPLGEILARFTSDRWGVPVARWAPTLALVHKYKGAKDWAGLACPYPLLYGSPDEYYARFLILLLDRLKKTSVDERKDSRGTHMVQWLRDGVEAGREDDVCWVLFHAFMYFQLRRMEVNRAQAPVMAVVRYYIGKMIHRKLVGGERV